MPYKNPIPYEKVAAALHYDAPLGVLTWKVNAAKNVKAGTVAGCVKTNSVGAKYRYVRLGHEVPAARIAWLLHYREWPLGKLFFADGDTLNIRIENLRLANSLLTKFDRNDPEQRRAYTRAHRKMFPRAWKDGQLRATFGIGLAEYSAMVAEQDNKCAICCQPETSTRDGKVKALAVDHDHATGAVRGLLCSDCNTGIGKLKEDRAVFLAAVRYLDKHADASNVINMKQEA